MTEYTTFLKESKIATNLLLRGISVLQIFIMENVTVYDKRTYSKKFILCKYMKRLTC